MKTTMTLEQKIAGVAGVLGHHNFIINDRTLADAINFIESGYDKSSTTLSQVYKNNLFAEQITSLKGMDLSIETFQISKSWEKAHVTVTGPIPGHFDQQATCCMTTDYLGYYLALALQDGFIKDVKVKLKHTGTDLLVLENGCGNIIVTLRLEKEPNFQKAMVFTLFVNLESAKAKSPSTADQEVEEESMQKYLSDIFLGPLVILSSGPIPKDPEDDELQK